MHVSGMIKMTCPPDILLATLHDPLALAEILPSGSTLDRSGADSFDFSISKSVGPIRLTMRGALTLAAVDGDLVQQMTINASHMIGGKVDVSLVLTIDTVDRVTRLGYDGDIDAQGLAGRVLKENAGSVDDIVKRTMTRLKHQAQILHEKGDVNTRTGT